MLLVIGCIGDNIVFSKHVGYYSKLPTEIQFRVKSSTMEIYIILFYIY